MIKKVGLRQTNGFGKKNCVCLFSHFLVILTGLAIRNQHSTSQTYLGVPESSCIEFCAWHYIQIKLGKC